MNTGGKSVAGGILVTIVVVIDFFFLVWAQNLVGGGLGFAWLIWILELLTAVFVFKGSLGFGIVAIVLSVLALFGGGLLGFVLLLIGGILGVIGANESRGYNY